VLKRSRADEVRNVSVLVAIGVGQDGFLKVLGITEGHRRTRRAGAVFSNTSNHAVPAVSG
jgi:transposase-like protein